MKRSSTILIAHSLFFLFLIQLTGTLIESIYILDLLNTTLDEKALGLLFFFSPVILLFFRKPLPKSVIIALTAALILARGITPYLNTGGRLLSSGIGLGTCLLLLPSLLLASNQTKQPISKGTWLAIGLAFSTLLSILFRTAYAGLDYSLFPAGGWTGWIMAILLGYSFQQLDWFPGNSSQERSQGAVIPVLGFFTVFSLILFAFSAPAVIARWTQGSYAMIVLLLSISVVSWITLTRFYPTWVERIPKEWWIAGNILFTLSLTRTILAHTPAFPAAPDSPAHIVGAPSLLQQVPLVLTLLLTPLLFVNIQHFARRLFDANRSPASLVPGILIGSFTLVLLAFMHIFSNVWGYVEPVSPWFRGKFWLPFLIMSAMLTILAGLKMQAGRPVKQPVIVKPSRIWVFGPAILLAAIVVSLAMTTTFRQYEPRHNSMKVMTYNIQQSNDEQGQRSYLRQLSLIAEVSPDILALQESDSARLSLNNNDYVRFFASRLGYHVYYGPKTVTGTYGTAILSRFPLQNAHTLFSYSNQDEIGTTAAEFQVDGQTFSIYNVHPDGSATAMMVFAQTVLSGTEGKDRIIVLGDFNLHPGEEAFQQIDTVLTNAWDSIYPNGISTDGTDMSDQKRIDHIFVSSDLGVKATVFLLPPASATDHPAHWAEVTWQ